METDDEPGQRWTGPTLLLAGARTQPHRLAGAVARALREVDHLQIQAIGPLATNQAVKALAIARGYLEGDGIDLEVAPTFADVVIDGEEMTAICFDVNSRQRALHDG